MKKVNITSIALLAYLVVMAVVFRPGGKYSGVTLTEYLLTLGATLGFILLIRFLQIKRMKMRDKWNTKSPEE